MRRYTRLILLMAVALLVTAVETLAAVQVAADGRWVLAGASAALAAFAALLVRVCWGYGRQARRQGRSYEALRALAEEHVPLGGMRSFRRFGGGQVFVVGRRKLRRFGTGVTIDQVDERDVRDINDLRGAYRENAALVMTTFSLHPWIPVVTRSLGGFMVEPAPGGGDVQLAQEEARSRLRRAYGHTWGLARGHGFADPGELGELCGELAGADAIEEMGPPGEPG